MPRSRKLHASEQIISARIFLVLHWTDFLPYKIIRFIRSLSLVQFVAPRQIRAKIIYLRVDLIDLRVIHACEWPLRNPTHPSSVINFKEYLMQLCLVSSSIILKLKWQFLRLDRYKVSDFFQVNRQGGRDYWRPPKLNFYQDFFALNVACDW